MEQLFQIENDNIIRVSRYKVTYYQHFNSYIEGVEPDESTVNDRYFISVEDADGFVNDYLAKHKALEYIGTTKIDTSSYEWVDGVEIPSEYQYAQDYIDELLAMGEEEYKISLTTTTEDYLLDLDCRLSMIELGVTE